MKGRLLVFFLLCCAMLCAMSLLVVSQAQTDEPPAVYSARILSAPAALLPQTGEADAGRADDVTSADIVLTVCRRGPAEGTPAEISPLPYTLYAFYAFHYSDRAG